MKTTIYLYLFLLIILSILVIFHVHNYLKCSTSEIKEGFHNNFDSYLPYYDISEYEKKETLDEQSLNDQMKLYKRGLDQKYDKITDPISDAFLPDYVDLKTHSDTKINEFIIINTYKTLLDRQPKAEELSKLLIEFYNGELNEDLLKTRIYNSTEYRMIAKMQSNDIDAGLISQVSAINMIDRLRDMYKKELMKDPVKEMLLPLKDCYIHLQYNDYLFRAMLRHANFALFEKEVLETLMLSREKLLDIFNKYFIMSELRLSANELKRQDLLSRKSDKVPEPDDKDTGTDLKNTAEQLGAGDQISRIVKDGNNVFNINIVLDESMVRGIARPYSNETKPISASNEDTCKIYDPIKYQQHYRGDMRYRPNVCSYGTKQVVQPIFLDSKTLFQGTDLNEAIENTQVGSIMPKFEYREYEEIKTN
jgi:hypothetical protein